MQYLSDFVEIFYIETNGITLKSLLSAFGIGICLVFLYERIMKRRRPVSDKNLRLLILLAAYAAFLLSITILRREEGSRNGIVHLHLMLGLGFRTGHPSTIVIIYVLYNLLLFIPLGLVLYLLLENGKIISIILKVTIISALISLAIESVQLITGRGMFEVTDLLTNTLGGAVGAVLAVNIIKVSSRRKQ